MTAPKRLNKTLILHTWGIGDMILLTPVLELIHAIHPALKFDFAVFQWASVLPIQRAPYMGSVHKCSCSPWPMVRDIWNIRGSKYDRIIVTSGTNSGKAGIYALLTGIRIRCGEYRSRDLSLYTIKSKFDPSISRTMGNIRLFSLLYDLPAPDVIFSDSRFRAVFRSRYYISSDSMGIATDFLNNTFTHQSFIVAIHPGCNTKNRYRRWNPDYFITLIKSLKTHFPDWEFYVIAGPDEREEGYMISRSTGFPLLTGVSLDVVAAALQQSHLLINTDSGIGHIASCFHIKTYTIFGPGDERQTAPHNPYATVIRSVMPCAPCVHQKRIRCRAECLTSLNPEVVAKCIVEDFDVRQGQ